jgi:hypothetical protein
MSNDQQRKIKLDWSRLLGFDQAARPGGDDGPARLSDAELAKLGAKFGNKGGFRGPTS